MRRGSRIRRGEKWAGATTCVLILVVWAFSAWYHVGWYFLYGDVHIDAGEVWLESWFPATADEMELTIERNSPCMLYWRLPDADFDVDPWIVRFPVWILALAVGIPTGILCRIDGNRPLPGHCPKCGYDLTGNVSGRCPECGEGVHSGESEA